jgi:hypothetical protein
LQASYYSCRAVDCCTNPTAYCRHRHGDQCHPGHAEGRMSI